MRVAVIGAGKLGEKHVRAYQTIDEATLAGIADVDSARLDVLSRSLGGEVKRFDSIEHALADDSVDAIDICTPTPTHYEHVAAALRAGKRVFCEKPLTLTRAEAEALHELVTRTAGTLRVGYVYRFHPRVRRLKENLDAGALGTPLSALFRIGGRGSHREWKHRQAEGGGAVLDMATHMIDLAYWLFGPFAEVVPLYTGLLMPKRRIGGDLIEVDAEDLAVIRLRSHSGVEAIVHADFITAGFSNTIEVSGTQGSALVSIVSALPDRYVINHACAGLGAGETVIAGEDADMLAMELRAFVTDAALGDDASDTAASIEVARAVEALTHGE